MKDETKYLKDDKSKEDVISLNFLALLLTKNYIPALLTLLIDLLLIVHVARNLSFLGIFSIGRRKINEACKMLDRQLDLYHIVR